MVPGSILTESGRYKSSTQLTQKKSSENSLPASFFLALAGGAIALSLSLAVSRKKRSWASFIGQWAPTILMLGIYDKILAEEKSLNEREIKTLH